MTGEESAGAVHPDGHAAALAALGVSPGRLRRLLAGRSAAEAWRELVTGAHPADPDGRLRAGAGRRAPDALARRCADAGVAVHVLGDGGYPAALAGDDEAPAVLFSQGALALLERRPRVAVVGTRSASAVGREVAADIAGALAGAGVTVVSGLAEGIGAAALSAVTVSAGAGRAVAVLGTAHDIVAGADRGQLRGVLAASGLALSELPPGAPSARWRFGARHRIVAALAQLVVVVECHAGEERGILQAARRRGVPLAAVPGSVRSPSSSGTNALLTEGTACVRGGADVVALLGACTGWRPGPPAGGRRPGSPRRRRRPGADGGEDALTGAVLAAMSGGPVGVDDVARVTGAPLGTVALCLERLAAGGRARADGGWWRLVPPAR